MSEELQGQSNISLQPVNDEPNYFDDLVEAVETDKLEQEQAQISAKMLTIEQFQASFIGIHSLASSVTGIKALEIPNSHVSAQVANEAADTLYETILDIPMLHFILQPGNKWLGRAFIMAIYAKGMRDAIAAEAQERRGDSESASGDTSRSTQATSTEKGDLTPEQIATLTNRS